MSAQAKQAARDAVADMLMTISFREWLALKAERDLLLVACEASEREYDEESTPGDGNCPDCTEGCIPIAKPRFCAHHLRVAAIRKAKA